MTEICKNCNWIKDSHNPMNTKCKKFEAHNHSPYLKSVEEYAIELEEYEKAQNNKNRRKKPKKI